MWNSQVETVVGSRVFGFGHSLSSETGLSLIWRQDGLTH